MLGMFVPALLRQQHGVQAPQGCRLRIEADLMVRQCLRFAWTPNSCSHLVLAAPPQSSRAAWWVVGHLLGPVKQHEVSSSKRL